MLRKIFAISFTLILLLALVTPALAITYGKEDGTAHKNVGVLVLDWTFYHSTYQWCSGTLIAPQVFLTAGHCMRQLSSILDNYPDSTVWLSFDSIWNSAKPGIVLRSGQMVMNPDYTRYKGQYGLSDPSDIGVVLLDKQPDGIDPATLPTLGLLDQLKADHQLDDLQYTAVGYGDTRDTNRTGKQAITYSKFIRRYSVGEYRALSEAWLTLSGNLATGDGGICAGDDGGPHFIDRGQGEILVSTTAVMDTTCKILDKTYRLDTESARSFLGQFDGVVLP
jgi:hypothetical protein